MQRRDRERRLAIAVVAAALVAASCGSGGDGDSTSTSSSTPPSETTTTVPEESTTTTVPLEASVVITGEEEMVFDWSEDNCGPEHLPDLPARAVRDADGMVSLGLAAPTIRRLIGPELDSLAVECEPIRRSTVDPDPGAYDFRGWLGALYTEDGETIHAVVHNEFHGDEASFAQSTRDFSAEPGANGWSYLGRVGSSSVDLAFADGEWRRGDTLCIVASWGAHPDADCDAVRRWTASASGEFSVWVSVSDVGLGGGDGVDVGITHNGTELWTHTVAEGDTDPVEAELTVPLAAGDELDFWVSARGDASFDATEFKVEINPGERPCPSGDRTPCQMMALTYARSTDGGASFATPEGVDHLVAAVPQRYEPDAGQFGIWQPSNIVAHPTDGYYYMLAQIDIHRDDLDVSGECLLRTDDLGDPDAWRAWDGEGFDYQFLDPYVDDVSGAEACVSVMNGPVWSLTYNTFLERFVAVSEVPLRSPAGVYFRTSTDLVNWEASELIIGWPDWTIGFATDFKTPFEAYPSILDPDSESMSFDTVGETAYMYFTRVNTYNPLDFDLLRLPIRFEK